MMLDTNLSEANAMFLTTWSHTTQKVGQNTSTYNTWLREMNVLPVCHTGPQFGGFILIGRVSVCEFQCPPECG